VRGESSRPDLEAWEQAVLSEALRAGAKVLGRLLERVGSGRRAALLLCTCGQAMRSVGLRSKQLTTLLGEVTYARSLYVCPSCGLSRVPGDQALDVAGTGFSPGVRRLMARAGSRCSFVDAEADLLDYAHVRAGRRDIERVAEALGRQVEAWMTRQHARPPEVAPPIPILYVSFDGTGCPLRRAELRGRKGKQLDGSAKGREVKIGCVFTQTTVDKDGFPIREADSTSYVGGIESSGLFGLRLFNEARSRGLDRARQVVVLTDGAAYNKTIAQLHFHGATHIIDLFHAREHLKALADLIFPNAPERAKAWRDRLDEGEVEHILGEAQQALPSRGARRKAALKEMRYFHKNTERMRYAEFRRRGFFVGSGVIEAGCRTLVGQRLKQSGMFWSLRGAHAILQLRCCILSRRFLDFWDDRAA